MNPKRRHDFLEKGWIFIALDIRDHFPIMLRLITIAFLTLLCSTLSAADHPKEINYELRGAWIATVYNIDWPSSSSLSEKEQKDEMLHMLNLLESLKMNAVFFQIRAECDAVYQSKYEPWSKSLTGSSGKYPGYDPLTFLIQEAHARGIEVHAWINPFRVQANATKIPSLHRTHVARQQPASVKKYRNYVWLDPSHIGSQERALRVVNDVLNRYDIDGIHLDDYFYPYPHILDNGAVQEEFPDSEEYLTYKRNGGKEERNEWRRGHINTFVQRLSDTVRKNKPWVRFGISPFGIWRSGFPRGIEAKTIAYEHLAADSRRWFQEEWVDYLAPQLYWSKNQPEQDFKKLYKWWVDQEKAHLWPGIATSRINDDSTSSRPADEIVAQIRYTRDKNRVEPGHIHWSVKSLLENRDGIIQKLKGLYLDAAVIPENPRAKDTPTSDVTIKVSYSAGKTKIEWTPQNKDHASSFLIQAKFSKKWLPMRVLGGSQRVYEFYGRPKNVSVQAINRYGKSGKPAAIEVLY